MLFVIAFVVAAAPAVPSDAELRRAWKGNDVYCEDIGVTRPISGALATLRKRGASPDASRHLALACSVPFDRTRATSSMRAALAAGPVDVVSVEVRKLIATAALRGWFGDRERDLLPLLVERERVFADAIASDHESLSSLSAAEMARVIDGYRRALALDPTSAERQLCLAGTLARVGDVDAALRALPPLPAFKARRKIVEAAAAAGRGDAKTVARLLEEEASAIDYSTRAAALLEELSCDNALRVPGCTITRALIAAGQIEMLPMLARVEDDCGALAAWSDANESPFDAYIRFLGSRAYADVPSVVLRGPTLLAKLGDVDMAREQLSWRHASCNAPPKDGESRSSPEVCAAVNAFVAGLPSPSKPAAVDAKLLKRLSAPAIWRGYDVVAPPKGAARARPKLDLERFAFGSVKPAFSALEGKRAVVVTYSRDLDPRGETSIGGYVVYSSNDAGKTWDGPLHTGFARGFPFEVRSKSAAPAFDGDVLQLPVDVSEVDPASITFPPVGLKRLRDEKDRVVRIPLSTLTRDSDGDSLTDIVEERLATDPSDVDTDADGTPDAFDRLPLEKRAPDDVTVKFAERALFVRQPAAIVPGDGLGTTVSDDKLPLKTRFFAGDAALPDVAGRSVRLGDAALAAYAKKLGPIYPLEIDVVMSADKQRAVVHLDEGWRWSAILVEMSPDGTFKTTTLSSAVT